MLCDLVGGSGCRWSIFEWEQNCAAGTVNWRPDC